MDPGARSLSRQRASRTRGEPSDVRATRGTHASVSAAVVSSAAVSMRDTGSSMLGGGSGGGSSVRSGSWTPRGHRLGTAHAVTVASPAASPASSSHSPSARWRSVREAGTARMPVTPPSVLRRGAEGASTVPSAHAMRAPAPAHEGAAAPRQSVMWQVQARRSVAPVQLNVSAGATPGRSPRSPPAPPGAPSPSYVPAGPSPTSVTSGSVAPSAASVGGSIGMSLAVASIGDGATAGSVVGAREDVHGGQEAPVNVGSGRNAGGSREPHPRKSHRTSGAARRTTSRPFAKGGWARTGVSGSEHRLFGRPVTQRSLVLSEAPARQSYVRMTVGNWDAGGGVGRVSAVVPSLVFPLTSSDPSPVGDAASDRRSSHSTTASGHPPPTSPSRRSSRSSAADSAAAAAAKAAQVDDHRVLSKLARDNPDAVSKLEAQGSLVEGLLVSAMAGETAQRMEHDDPADPADTPPEPVATASDTGVPEALTAPDKLDVPVAAVPVVAPASPQVLSPSALQAVPARGNSKDGNMSRIIARAKRRFTIAGSSYSRSHVDDMLLMPLPSQTPLTQLTRRMAKRLKGVARGARCRRFLSAAGKFVKQWKHIRAEVVSSERTYFSSLRDCVGRYVDPLRQRLGTADEVLSQKEMFNLFGNVVTVEAASNFMLQHFAKCTSENVPVATMFEPLVPLFASYSSYVSNYHRSVPLLQQQAKPGTAFHRFLSQAAMRRSMADLSSKLIMPVQRLPRYKLLVESLCKTATRLCNVHATFNESEAHPVSATTREMDDIMAQASSLASILRVVEEACTKINEGTRAAESAEIIAGVTARSNLSVCLEARIRPWFLRELSPVHRRVLWHVTGVKARRAAWSQIVWSTTFQEPLEKLVGESIPPLAPVDIYVCTDGVLLVGPSAGPDPSSIETVDGRGRMSLFRRPSSPAPESVWVDFIRVNTLSCHLNPLDPKGVRIRFEKVRAFEFFLLSPVDCAKMVDAVTQAHEGVIYAEQEAEALKRSVTERELGALEAIAGSAILERFGIEAELSDVLHMLNTATPDTVGAPDPDPRQIAFALAEELGKVNSRIDDAVANRCALSLLLFMKKDLLQQKDPQAVTARRRRGVSALSSSGPRPQLAMTALLNRMGSGAGAGVGAGASIPDSNSSVASSDMGSTGSGSSGEEEDTDNAAAVALLAGGGGPSSRLDSSITGSLASVLEEGDGSESDAA